VPDDDPRRLRGLGSHDLDPDDARDVAVQPLSCGVRDVTRIGRYGDQPL
jgi:hypothetical protein